MQKSHVLNATEILMDFPNFELSYETMMHNKVHNSDIILAIPDGLKFFAWFTEYNDENVCFIFDAINRIFFEKSTFFNITNKF